ncbi:MAG: hypothetical protein QOG83_127 [Alphaproteobacteria bacterium]|nr:hypothetical protein [Alphaproteobacteria bacterium]
MRRLGAEPKLASPQEFAAFLAAEAQQWAAVAKAAAVKRRPKRSAEWKPDPRDPEGRARRRQGSAGRHSGGG